ncbi:D-beta-hydroxybutyrate dehydrogenase [Minicystis rosea]|nr:D-beta-hydroxybutyrate dehydrogenase [Minicystis rosea]
MSLAARVALVTGGGRGIGRAIASRLAREGARVVVAGRTRSEVEEVAAELGGVAVVMDVADRASVAEGLAAVAAVAAAGPVDILVNNAGAAESAPLDRTTDEMWDRMLAVNATSTFTLCRALIPKMVERGYGRVVNVASNAGLTGYAYTAAYCAAKHAVVGLTRAIAMEVARTPVTVNAVCPGFVATRLADEAVDRIVKTTGRSAEEARRSLAAMSPQRRLVEPEEVAHVVAMLCSDAARSVHGQAIPIDGGQVM